MVNEKQDIMNAGRWGTHVMFRYAAAARHTQGRGGSSIIERRVSCYCNGYTSLRRDICSMGKDRVQLQMIQRIAIETKMAQDATLVSTQNDDNRTTTEILIRFAHCGC